MIKRKEQQIFQLFKSLIKLYLTIMLIFHPIFSQSQKGKKSDTDIWSISWDITEECPTISLLHEVYGDSLASCSVQLRHTDDNLRHLLLLRRRWWHRPPPAGNGAGISRRHWGSWGWPCDRASGRRRDRTPSPPRRRSRTSRARSGPPGGRGPGSPLRTSPRAAAGRHGTACRRTDHPWTAAVASRPRVAVRCPDPTAGRRRSWSGIGRRRCKEEGWAVGAGRGGGGEGSQSRRRRDGAPWLGNR